MARSCENTRKGTEQPGKVFLIGWLMLEPEEEQELGMFQAAVTIWAVTTRLGVWHILGTKRQCGESSVDSYNQM